MNIFKSFTCVICLAALIACSQKEASPVLTIKNTIDIGRSFETVELSKEYLKAANLTTIGLRDIETGAFQLTQTVDTNNDGEFDQLLFQPTIAASSEKQYEIVIINENEKPTATNYCYSRFVPERTDDYTWENDKVAFRVYGPTAQKMTEDGIKGGTLSSGVDAWLKKVEYPIIDKWYKESIAGVSSYHEDTGEGLDNFHVGISRGVGGIAVKINDSYHFSKNYTEWKTITTGPIRTSFYLNYADWDANGSKIIESKVISLDRGSNLSKFTTSIQGSDKIAAGLTLHEKDGEVSGNNDKGWVSYWQPHDGSELGTAIVADSNTFNSFEKYDVVSKDHSNAYAHLKVTNNTVTYYAGFTWKESGQFKSKEEWETYLDVFSQKMENPLVVSFE